MAELVGERHQQDASGTGLDIFFGGIGRPALKHRGQGFFKTLSKISDGDHIILDTESGSHLARIDLRNVGGIA